MFIIIKFCSDISWFDLVWYLSLSDVMWLHVDSIWSACFWPKDRHCPCEFIITDSVIKVTSIHPSCNKYSFPQCSWARSVTETESVRVAGLLHHKFLNVAYFPLRQLLCCRVWLCSYTTSHQARSNVESQVTCFFNWGEEKKLWETDFQNFFWVFFFFYFIFQFTVKLHSLIQSFFYIAALLILLCKMCFPTKASAVCRDPHTLP